MNVPWKQARNVSSPGQHDDMASQQVAVVLLLWLLVLTISQLLHNLTAGVTVRRSRPSPVLCCHEEAKYRSKRGVCNTSFPRFLPLKFPLLIFFICFSDLEVLRCIALVFDLAGHGFMKYLSPL